MGLAVELGCWQAFAAAVAIAGSQDRYASSS
jgi:hypothetical protein